MLKLLGELVKPTNDFSFVILLIQILFIYIDNTDENLAKPYLTLFGLEESNSTVVSFPHLN